MHWSRWCMHFSSLSWDTVRLLTLYYGKFSQASLAAAQIKNNFSLHSQNVPSDTYTLGIQGSTYTVQHEKFTPFLSGPPMLQFFRIGLEYHSGNLHFVLLSGRGGCRWLWSRKMQLLWCWGRLLRNLCWTLIHKWIHRKELVRESE